MQSRENVCLRAGRNNSPFTATDVARLLLVQWPYTRYVQPILSILHGSQLGTVFLIFWGDCQVLRVFYSVFCTSVLFSDAGYTTAVKHLTAIFSGLWYHIAPAIHFEGKAGVYGLQTMVAGSESTTITVFDTAASMAPRIFAHCAWLMQCLYCLLFTTWLYSAWVYTYYMNEIEVKLGLYHWRNQHHTTRIFVNGQVVQSSYQACVSLPVAIAESPGKPGVWHGLMKR